MKQDNFKKAVWIWTGVYWVIGVVNFFWGGVKNITNPYGISLIVALMVPLIFAILTTLKVKIPKRLLSIKVACLYLIIVVAVSLGYQLQDIIGYFLLLIIVIFFAILSIFYALFKTFRYRKNGKYYYVDGKKEKPCRNFGEAFLEYYFDGLVFGVIEVIIDSIF